MTTLLSKPTFHAELKSCTESVHHKLETIPFFTALHQGAVHPISAITYLRCLSILHATLEHALERSKSPLIRSFWRKDLAKLPLLLEDLKLVDGARKPQIKKAVDCSLALASKIVTDCEQAPASLLGALYVLEGAQNGGVMLRPRVAASLSVAPERLSYFGAYGTETAAHWRSFTAALNALSIAPEERYQAVAAAASLFVGMGELSGHLLPFEHSDLAGHVTALNPEAGAHSIPDDPAEIAAALVASDNTWRKHPYLEKRFAGRGKRFSASDSCWLLTLTTRKEAVIRKSILWLRAILSSRGIPSIILESHMEELYANLCDRSPARGVEAAAFKRVAEGLRQERCKCSVPGADFPAPEQSMEAFELLLSAYADEKNGVPGAFASVASWFSREASNSSQIEALSARLR
jgi:heme oxygenase